MKCRSLCRKDSNGVCVGKPQIGLFCREASNGVCVGKLLMSVSREASNGCQ